MRILRVVLILGISLATQAWSHAANESSRKAPVWMDPNHGAPHGSRYFAFESATVGQKVSCLVWLPPAYARNPNARFPVIYWLHGANGNQRKCAGTFLPAYVKALKQRACPPAIVVAVNGIPGSFYGDSVDGRCPVESVIISDLVPAIDRSFRTKATREGRLIEGFSMGGFGTARLGFKHPEVFGAVNIMSAGPLPGKKGLPPPLIPVYGVNENEMPGALAAKNVDALRKRTLIRIVCGGDDRLLSGNKGLHNRLERLGIPHVYREFPGVDHSSVKIYQQAGVQFFSFHRRAFEDREAAPARKTDREGLFR